MKTWLFPLWVIIDVLVFLAAIALWIAAPEHSSLNIGVTIFAVTLGILLSMLKLEEIKVFVKSSYFKKMLYHSINIFLVISIVSLINYLANKNHTEFDLTREKRNSLTDQTRKVLEIVDAPLSLTVFAKREDWAGILNVLKLYQSANKWVKLDAIDTDARPDLVKSNNITNNGTVIINYKGRDSSFVIQDELSVTNALLKILKTNKVTIYLVTGHQELSCEDKGQEGISALCEKLQSQNYLIKKLDLGKVKEVPEDASAVLVLGPTTGFFSQEALSLKNYLSKGGSLFLALAPAFKPEIYDNISSLAAPYGLKLGKDVVVDRLSTIQGSEATIPIINKYDETHAITHGFSQRTVFPLSSSVQTIGGNDSATLLAFTSDFPGSWAETDLKGIAEGKSEYQENRDAKGPIGVLGISEKTVSGKDSRFVLLGSSSSLINAYQNQTGNMTLFMNAVSWIVNDEGIISFNRPGIEEDPVILSGQHLQMIFVISILLVPIIYFGAAIFIYRRRRLL